LDLTEEVAGVKGSAPGGSLALLFLLLISTVVAGCQRAKPPRLVLGPSATPALVTGTLAEVAAAPSAASTVRAQDAYPQPGTPTSSPAALTPTATPIPPEAAATPSPAATNTPAPAGEITHVVRAGDTLLSIAAHYGSTMAAIINRNGIKNPHLLYVGQVLIVPIGGNLAQTPTSGTIQHIVKAGETLSQLARLYRTTVEAIRSANPSLQDPQRLSVGTVLTITVGTAPPIRTHVVRRGENLASIARRYGVSMQALVQANGLVDPNRLTVGQVLIIP